MQSGCAVVKTAVVVQSAFSETAGGQVELVSAKTRSAISP